MLNRFEIAISNRNRCVLARRTFFPTVVEKTRVPGPMSDPTDQVAVADLVGSLGTCESADRCPGARWVAVGEGRRLEGTRLQQQNAGHIPSTHERIQASRVAAER